MSCLRSTARGLLRFPPALPAKYPGALAVNDYDAAREAALRYRRIFGEGNFYLELQDHGIREQKYVNPQIIRLSAETGIPLVVTNDCHYIMPEDEQIPHPYLYTDKQNC